MGLDEETHQASPGHEEPGNKEPVDAVGQFPGNYQEELGACWSVHSNIGCSMWVW